SRAASEHLRRTAPGGQPGNGRAPGARLRQQVAIMSTVKLIGLDFGTTTSSAVIASAELMRNAVTGRRQVSRLHECYRSEMVFTPFGDEGLDERKLEEHLDTWLAAARVRPNELFG